MVDAATDPTLQALHEAAPGVLRRDPDALERVYELTADLLASVAYGILRDRHAAEDVVQEAFLRLIRAAGGIREADGRVLRAWLVTATRNLCMDRLRSAPFRRERVTDDPVDEGVTLEIEPDADPRIDEALGRLTDDQRQAVVLFHVAGLSGAEVGAAMGRNRAAVYTLLRRAERQLRKHLTDPSDTTLPLRP